MQGRLILPNKLERPVLPDLPEEDRPARKRSRRLRYSLAAVAWLGLTATLFLGVDANRGWTSAPGAPPSSDDRASAPAHFPLAAVPATPRTNATATPTTPRAPTAAPPMTPPRSLVTHPGAPNAMHPWNRVGVSEKLRGGSASEGRGSVGVEPADHEERLVELEADEQR